MALGFPPKAPRWIYLIASAVDKFKNVNGSKRLEMAFIANYTFLLGVDDLLPLGAEEPSQSGKLHFERYPYLFDEERLPFVRSSGSERVVQSALNWTAGFSKASGFSIKPHLDVVISEDKTTNNTLDDAMCPRAGTSDNQTGSWLAVYAPPITSRLSSSTIPRISLLDADTQALMSLCAFESVALRTRSPWCALFSPSEFASFAYGQDLGKFYGKGYGQPLGPVQGVGYVNELLARLTGTPVHDHTQTNRTLDSSPVTFPLYADFSHDNSMISVYSALGLFKQPRNLSATRMDRQRTWRVERLVPFSGRMVVERLDCEGLQYVRVLVNDALQPLEECATGDDGLCTLEAFVKSQKYARHQGMGDFQRCYGR